MATGLLLSSQSYARRWYKMPRKPTKEFWEDRYPDIEAEYKKRYPKDYKERARKATASIWYDKLHPATRKRYEKMREKREGKNNPGNPSKVPGGFIHYGIGTMAIIALLFGILAILSFSLFMQWKRLQIAAPMEAAARHRPGEPAIDKRTGLPVVGYNDIVY